MFNNPPTLLVDGELIPLDQYHKVIFAGNPLSYADERTQSPLFERHGNAVLFEPLPLALIYEDVISPIFKDTPLQESRAALAEPILKSYQFITQLSSDDVRISPRELQMMALLTSSYCERYPSANPQEVAKYYAHQIARPLVPAAHLNRFDEEMRVPLALKQSTSDNLASFLITDSRQAVTQQLNDLLALSRYRREKASQNVQRYGGLGGIILEGEPGIGKSELVTQLLVANGYQEIHKLSDKPLQGLSFLRLAPSLSIEEKEASYLYAFKKGLIVVADEINSSPMMERLLNSLLMGETLTGEKPEQPGFMIIGTQNPITMRGRLAPSTALARRLLTVELPPYTNEEMEHILIAKGIEKKEASALVNAYSKQLALGKQQFRSPLPCFRDVLKAATAILEGKKKAFATPFKAVLDSDQAKAPEQKAAQDKVLIKAPVRAKVLKQEPVIVPAKVPEQKQDPAPAKVPKQEPVIVPAKSSEQTTAPANPIVTIDNLVEQFNANHEEFINKIKSYQKGNNPQKAIYNTGYALLKNIDNITKNKPETLKNTKLEELNTIISAAKNLLNEPTNDQYKRDLAKCSAKACGKKSPTWRKLGLSLMLFGAAVLVLIGVLAAIPTTGVSLASALGIVSLVAAGGALSVGAGAFSFFHGREKGMNKTINQLEKALKDDPEPPIINK